MGLCSPGFVEVAKGLGRIDCASAPAVVSVRNPFTLANWTMPVVEAVVVIGAVAALVHAVLWWRRRGDPTNLALWFATVVYVLVLEPPLYFPDRFGLQDRVGLIFVHNLFSVQFLYNRLPLYIVAFYPAMTYLVYALVQRTGVLERTRPLVGAACVAFVFHCFYEIFDQIGPQLRWWAWNPDAPSNTPWLTSVPLSSAVIFAGAAPFGMALLTRVLLVRRATQGPVPAWSMVLRTIGVAVLTPLAMVLFAAPYSLLAGGGGRSHVTGQAVVLWLEIAVIAAVAVTAFWRAAQERPRTIGELPGYDRHPYLDRYPVLAGAVFLLAFTVFWATAFPAYLVASDGHTSSGAPTGNLGYVLLCAAACLGVLTLAATRSPTRTVALAAA